MATGACTRSSIKRCFPLRLEHWRAVKRALLASRRFGKRDRKTNMRSARRGALERGQACGRTPRGGPPMSINRAEVGARVTGTTVSLGLYLPGIAAADGFQVNARIIHSADQFRPEIPAVNVPLAFDATHPLG